MSNKNENKDKAAELEKNPVNHEENATAERTGNISKKMKYGGISTAMTVIFIALVVLVNVLVSVINDKLSLDIDLTDQKYFKLSNESIDYIEGIDSDVEISILLSKESFESGGVIGTYTGDSVIDTQFIELMDKYENLSSHISVEYVDIVKNPAKVSELGKYYSGELAQGSVVVRSGERVRVFSITDIVLFDEEKYQENQQYMMYYGSGIYTKDELILGYDTENTFTSAIAFVTNPNPVNIAVVGDAENGSIADGLVQTLELNGYAYEYVDLLTAEIPQDISLLIIPGPTNDYTDVSIDKLDKYLYNDGKYGTDILYIASVEQYDTPKLDSFLKNWGFIVSDGAVREQNTDCYTDYNGVQILYAQVKDNSENENYKKNYNSGIVDESLPIWVVNPTPIRIAYDHKSDFTLFSLLTTSDDAVIVDADGNVIDDSNGSYDIAAISSRKQYVDNVLCENNVMVFSSAYLIGFNDDSINNFNWIIGALNTMSEKEDAISFTISSTTVKKYELNMSKKQAKTVQNIVIFVIPVAVLVVCGVVWYKRKHR